MLRRMTLALALVLSTVLAPSPRSAQANSPARASNTITPATPLMVRAGLVVTLSIHDIQAATHRSPYVGQAVQAIRGIVTAVDGSGYYFQDPTPDADEATSEAIFVYTAGAPGVSVGDAISVSATVAEFYPDFGSNAELSITELITPVVSILSTGNPLPAPIVVGTGGRIPPDMVIENDASGDVETTGVFDPAQDGLDFWESLEGMQVQVNGAIVVAGTSNFGELVVVGDDGANGGLLSPRGALVIREADFNPERIIIADSLVSTPDVNVGVTFTLPIVGVIDYNFGNFKLQATTLPAPNPGGVVSETTTLVPSAGQLTVATMNVENLDANDAPAKFAALAARIANNMQSPDILVLEEVQDNDGATNNGIVNSDDTLNTLVTAVVDAGGPSYSYRYVAPANNQDGGEPGGNIRVVFFYRTDRGVAFVDRPGATATTANSVILGADGPQLQYSPGRINPTSPAFNTSRKPLAGEFTFMGARLFVIGNHWNSKGGDDPLMGRYQPPNLSSETQRLLQAQEVKDFVDDLLALDPDANIVVLGDLNDFQWSPPLDTLTAGGVLNILINTLPENERYSYVFEGNAQVLDHILLSDNLFDHTLDGFDVVHVNAEFTGLYQASDHDPSLARLAPAGPDLAGSAKGVNTTSAMAGDLVTYTLKISNSGGSTAFYALTDTLDANVSLVSAPGLNGASTLTATGILGPGAQQTYTLTVRIKAAFNGTVNNSASLTGDGTTRQLNAPAVNVVGPNLTGSSKTVNDTAITAGDLLTYTLTLSNSGAISATYRLTDTLDPNLTLVSAPGLNGTSTLTGTGVLAANSQQTFVVTVQASLAYSGTLHNTAHLSGDGLTRNLNAPPVTVSPVAHKVYLPIFIKH